MSAQLKLMTVSSDRSLSDDCLATLGINLTDSLHKESLIVQTQQLN